MRIWKVIGVVAKSVIKRAGLDGVLKIRGPRRVCFQEIMGCFNFGFWMMDWGGAAVAGNE
jgi:hypothetical protein